MQNTTANYKLEINKPSREFECKITIGNNIYNNEELVNLTLEHTQPQEGFSIGDTISQSLDLTLLNRGDIIYSTSQIKVEIGLKIGSTIEYILMGIFNIDDIEKTDYTTKFTAYDNMIKFETPYFSSLGDKPTLKQVVNELSKITGIEFIGSLPNYTVSKLEGFTCREVLSYVASICGGNAVITRDGKFTIKSLSEIKKSIDGNNYFNYKREEVKYKIGKISCQIDENNILYKGSTGTDSMELGFENPWVTETILNDLYNKLNGLSYLGYSMKWQGDLSLDPYDIVTVTDIKNVIRKIPILSQKISYTGGLTSEIGAKGESKNKNNFSSSGSTTNKVNRAIIEQAIIKEALIEKANIKDVEAVSIRTQILEAKTAKIEEAIIDVAHISDLNAINANIQNLIANDVKINNALINKADITELNAVVGNINIINSELANIKTLVNGNLSSENIQAGGITSDKLTIANGFITNAMIANLDVSKINAGNISTNKFRIVSDNGGIEIVGATQQFKDKNNKVRIQMGQDAKGNFNFILRGEDGTTTLIDHTGIKEKAIADNLIKGNMVATDAIGEKQINYSSLITGLNKDTNTQLIKASKVAIDFVGQSLEVAFNSLKSNVDSKETRNLFIENNTVDGYYNDTSFVNASSYRTSDYIEVNEGEIYTVCKFSTNGYHRIVCFDKNKNKIGTRVLTESITFKYKIPLGIKYIRISIEKTNKYKIEKGENPNPVWNAAPEDVDSSIETVKQITESNSTTINVMQGQINTAINNTQIVKDGKTILLKDDYNRTVSKVDSINSTIGTHTTKINELTGNIISVDTKVNSVQRDLEGTKSTVSSYTNLIDGLNSKVSTQGSSIEQLKNQITLKVNSTELTTMKNELIGKIDSIEIGGRNTLLNATGNLGNTNHWSNVVLDTNKKVEGCNSFKITRNNFANGNARYQGSQTIDLSRLSLKANDYITLSGWVYVDSSINLTGSSNEFAFRNYYNSSSSFEDLCVFKYANIQKNTWTKFSVTSKVTKDSYKAGALLLSISANGLIYVSKLKLEKGSKATDFTLAPEDIDSEIGTKANKTDVYVKSEVYTKSQTDSAIKVAKDSIELGVKNTYETKSSVESKLSNVTNTLTGKIDAIQVGGRNLAQGASNIYTTAYSSFSGGTNTCPSLAKVLTDGLVVGDTVTVKLIYKYTNIVATSGQTAKCWIQGYGNSTSWNSGAFNSSTQKILSGSGEHTFLYSFKITPEHLKNSSWSTSIRHDYVQSGSVQWKMFKVEKGNKATDFTLSPEDVDLAIDKKANIVDVYKKSETYTKSETDSKINVAKDQINLSVSGIYETKTNVESKINTAKANAINSAKSYTDGQITTVNKTITNKVSEIKATTDSISQKVSTTESKITTINNNISGLTNRVSTAESKLTATSLTTTISSAITGGTSSISTTQFVMDKNGLTIKNGALTIKNKAGTTVLNSDTNGNLIFTGTAKSQSGARWVGLDSGGITFQDSQKNEQMLRIAISYFNENRDINGVNLSLAKYGDYIRISHIDKADLTTGWSSSNTQYNFMDFWSSDQIVDGVAYKKGINVYAPMYIHKRLKLYSGTNFLSEIDGAISWNNGTGTVNNLLGMYGDNGAVIGYKSGDSFNARFLVSEVSHPGTGDNLISWGNYNGNGYTLHNFNIVAKSLSVQGSKNCLQETKSYGARLINAYETAEYYFGDIGFGKINEECVCYVDIDDVFLECVNTDAQYHVFTQIYNGKITSIERYKTYFIVKGEQNTEFSWELKAKRKGYEINRLDLPDIETQGDEIDIFSFENEIETDEEDLMKELTFELENLLLKEHEKDE